MGMDLVKGKAKAAQRGLETARAVLKVLNYLVAHPGGVSPAEVGEFLGKSAHTAYYLLNSLCLEGFAEHGADHKYYLKLSRNAAPPSDAVASAEILKGFVGQLNRATRCRVYLWIQTGDRVHLEQTIGNQGQPKALSEGHILSDELHATATGKLVLANLSKNELQAYCKKPGLKAFTAHTITKANHLEAELDEVRQNGVALSQEEYASGLFAIAAPVTLQSNDRTLIATFEIAVPKSRFQIDRQRLIKQTQTTAAQARQKLEGDFVWATLFG